VLRYATRPRRRPVRSRSGRAIAISTSQPSARAKPSKRSSEKPRSSPCSSLETSGLGDAKPLGCRPLAEAKARYGVADDGSEPRFQQALVGLGQVEVGKNVAAADHAALLDIVRPLYTCCRSISIAAAQRVRWLS
jgi:hypothetical protein